MLVGVGLKELGHQLEQPQRRVGDPASTEPQGGSESQNRGPQVSHSTSPDWHVHGLQSMRAEFEATFGTVATFVGCEDPLTGTV